MEFEASCKDIEQHLKAILKASVENSEAKGKKASKPRQQAKKNDQYEDNFPLLPDHQPQKPKAKKQARKSNPGAVAASGAMQGASNSAPQTSNTNKKSRNKYKVNQNGNTLEKVDLKRSLACSNGPPMGDPAVISMKETINASPTQVSMGTAIVEVMKRHSQSSESDASKQTQQQSNSGRNRNRNNERIRNADGGNLDLNERDDNFEVTRDKHGKIVGYVSKALVKELEPEFLQVLTKQSENFPAARFYCRLCSFHCDMMNYERHIKNEKHQNFKEMHRTELLLRNLPSPTATQSAAVTKVIEDLYDREKLSEQNLKDRQDIVDLLNSVMSKTPDLDCKFQLYGSSVSKFALQCSDVNIDMILTSVEELSKKLSIVNDILIKEENFMDVTSDFQAKMPRISFVHFPSKLLCHISWNNTASLQTSRLFASYAAIDPRVLKLGLAVRFWAKICLLDQQDRCTLPTHSFIILLIYYLQQLDKPVLPVLQELSDPNQTTENVEEKLVDIETPRNEFNIKSLWKTENNQSVGELWIDFLRFYSVDFLVTEYVVCIRRHLPMSRAEKKWDGRVIAIEDPSYRKRNLSRSIPNHHVYRHILERFRQTYKYFGIPQFKDKALYDDMPKELYKKNWKPRMKPVKTGDTAAPEASSPKKKDKKLVDFESDGSSDTEFMAMDGQDPDLSFDEVAEAMLGMNLDCRHLRTESESSEVLPPEVDKLVKNEDKRDVYVQKLMEQFLKEPLVYDLKSSHVIGKQKPPIYCRFCQKEGHLCETCPSQILPELVTLPPMNSKLKQCLDKACEEVIRECIPPKRELDDRKRILAELETWIHQIYDDAKLELFGSSCNGFGFMRSDIDICMTFDGNKTGEGLDYAFIIERLAINLKNHPKLNNLLAIKTAKVPIVKFTYVGFDVECDISLYNTLAQHNTRMLRMYCEIDPRVQILGYTMKLFAKLCDIGDASRGSLSSYAYILMVIHFLQQRQPPVIPVLQELYDKNQTKPEVLVDGWNAWFYDNASQLSKEWPEHGRNTESVGLLWLSMLRFYTEEFNFKENVITIRQLAPLTRFEKVWNSRSIAIEDPFDLNHNLGGGVSINMNTYIMKALIRGRENFGWPPDMLPRDPLSFFFDQDKLMVEKPPNDHGCRICRKIGHKMKDCPNKREVHRGRMNRNNGQNHQENRARPQHQNSGHQNSQHQNSGHQNTHNQNAQQSRAGYRKGFQEQQRPDLNLTAAVKAISSSLKNNSLQPQRNDKKMDEKQWPPPSPAKNAYPTHPLTRNPIHPYMDPQKIMFAAAAAAANQHFQQPFNPKMSPNEQSLYAQQRFVQQQAAQQQQVKQQQAAQQQHAQQHVQQRLAPRPTNQQGLPGPSDFFRPPMPLPFSHPYGQFTGQQGNSSDRLTNYGREH